MLLKSLAFLEKQLVIYFQKSKKKNPKLKLRKNPNFLMFVNLLVKAN